MGDIPSDNQYGKLDPPNTHNPAAKFQSEADYNQDSTELKNPQSALLTHLFSEVCVLLQMYGWYIVFTIIFGIVIWTNIRHTFYGLLSRLQKKMSKNENNDPETIQKRLEAMERARLRMQTNYEEQLQKKLIKIKEREEQKRLDAIHDHDQMKAGKSQSSTLRKNNHSNRNDSSASVTGMNKHKKPLRDSDYNPLTGTSNSGPRYRPSSRRPTAGG